MAAFHANEQPRWQMESATDPRSAGGKPARLDYVVQSLGQRGARFDYIVMVDADTLVPPDLVIRLMETAGAETRRDWPAALQPLLVSLPGDGGGLFARAEAAMHTRWRLGYELTLLRIAGRDGQRRKRPWTPLSYAVGCCLAVRIDYARQGFHIPAEDLGLGYALARGDLALVPVPVVVETTTKATVRDIAARHVAWFRFSRVALGEPGASGPARMRSNLLVFAERLRLLAWVPGTALFVVGLGCQFAARPLPEAAYTAGILFGFAGATYVTAGLGLLWAGPTFTRGWDNQRFSTVAACMARWTWSCGGAAAIVAADRLLTHWSRDTTARRVTHAIERLMPTAPWRRAGRANATRRIGNEGAQLDRPLPPYGDPPGHADPAAQQV